VSFLGNIVLPNGPRSGLSDFPCRPLFAFEPIFTLVKSQQNLLDSFYSSKEVYTVFLTLPWLVVGAGLCFMSVAVIYAYGQYRMTFLPRATEASKELRANSFILEDANGRVRASLGMSEDGPVLRLNNENGDMGAALYLHDKSGLSLFDKSGNTRAFLGVVKNAPVLFLFDENGKARARLFFTKETGPGLSLYDAKGQLVPIR
jgi:hypothetical protein